MRRVGRRTTNEVRALGAEPHSRGIADQWAVRQGFRAGHDEDVALARFDGQHQPRHRRELACVGPRGIDNGASWHGRTAPEPERIDVAAGSAHTHDLIV